MEHEQVEKEEIEEEEESREIATRKNIQQLVQETLENGKKISTKILTLDEWQRPGSPITDWGVIIVLYGEVEKVEVDSKYEYPNTNTVTYEIIPKTKTVVILYENGDDYGGFIQRYQTLYVFHYRYGWRYTDIP